MDRPKFKASDLRAQLIPLLSPPLDPATEEVKLVKCDHDSADAERDGHSSYLFMHARHSTILKDDEEIADTFFNSYQIRAYR